MFVSLVHTVLHSTLCSMGLNYTVKQLCFMLLGTVETLLAAAITRIKL